MIKSTRMRWERPEGCSGEEEEEEEEEKEKKKKKKRVKNFSRKNWR